LAQEKPFANQTGLVFNIQRYSLHDGPGIRTLVFLKGCPLRCRWCSNPESQLLDPELAYNEGKCIGSRECSLCLKECPSGAVFERESGKMGLDRGACQACFHCADVCPSLAMKVFGERMSVEQVLGVAEADGIFYARSGGGITLSGGEPLVQAGFAAELLGEARRRRLNTSMETSGFGDWHDMERICRNLDSILFDIKCMDPAKHKAFVGVSNENILENFLRLCDSFPELPKKVRTPVVPGFNDDETEIGAVVDFIAHCPQVDYELLAYHRLGQPKYCYLGRDYPLANIVLSEERLRALDEMAKERMAGRGSAQGT
jgi:pyruvate formate lyase activating enzyme